MPHLYIFLVNKKYDETTSKWNINFWNLTEKAKAKAGVVLQNLKSEAKTAILKLYCTVPLSAMKKLRKFLETRGNQVKKVPKLGFVTSNKTFWLHLTYFHFYFYSIQFNSKKLYL